MNTNASSTVTTDDPSLYLGTALLGGHLCHVWLDGTVLPILAGSASDGMPIAYASEAEFLDEVSAATFLNIPLIRLQKWRKGGRIPYFKPTHKTVLFDKRDLIALMTATRVEATTPPPAPRSHPKSPEHRAAIAAGQSAAWERRRAESTKASPAKKARR